MSDEEIGTETDLINLDTVSLADLAELDDSVLAHALRRVLAEVDGSEDAVAAFQAFI